MALFDHTPEFTIRLLEFIYRYRLLWVVTGVLSVFLVAFLLIVSPRSYWSDAKLIVRIGRESVTLDPTATTSQTITMQKTQEEEINSALEIVYSRRIKEAVIKQLGLDAILSGVLEDGKAKKKVAKQNKIVQGLREVTGKFSDFLLDIGVRDAVSDYERAIIKLDAHVHVSAYKKSRVIGIYATAKSPEMAQAIADAMAQAYIAEHLKISQTRGSFEFFETETLITQRALKNAKLEMAQYMSENRIVSVTANQELLKNAWNGIFANILSLESKEKAMAATFNESHPNRIQVKEELDSARQVLRSLQSRKDDIEKLRLNSRNANRPNINSNLSAKSDRTLVTRIESLIFANNELEGLHGKVKTLESRLDLHRKKLEEARLIREQRKSSISNITVFQPATLNRKPIAPNKPLIAIATPFLSFCFAALLGLLKDSVYRMRYLRTPTDVERNLKLPVVAKIYGDRTAVRPSKNDNSLQKSRSQCHDLVHSLIQMRNSHSVGSPQGVLVGVLGVDHGSGGSTVAAVLAACCSKDFGLNVLLVDGDRKQRSVSNRFSLNGAPGLHELVQGEAEVEDCIQRFEPFNLSLLSSTGKTSSNLGFTTTSVSKSLEELERLRSQYDIVLVDLPSATAADSFVSLAPLIENVLIVAESGRTTIEQAVSVLRKFDSSESNVCGVVLNKCRVEFPWQKS